MSSSANNIRVVCRFRPQNSIEDREGGKIIVSLTDDHTSVQVNSKEYPGQFTFDRIFDWKTQQEDVFNECGQTLVNQCFEGYNSTLFCYGQTGSGKTYTMMGGSIDDPASKGMTPRLVERIFETIEAAPSTLEFTVRVSFMEIYMEKIRDLLRPQNDNLPVHEEKSRGVYVKGLQEVYVSSVKEVLEVMRIGDQSRAVSSTNMNEQSSRSHSIFVLTIGQKDLVSGSVKSGKLYLVDLAGSEKVGKTGATGQTLEEAKKINKSLTALGMVINSLTDGKSTHVPYRDSKLTRILQESLGGNSRTTLIINCSPSSYNDAETLSTLRFGMRAKSIKNKAKVNVELSAAELKALLKQANTQITTFQVYIAELETELGVWRTGGKVSPENYAKNPGITASAVKLDAEDGDSAAGSRPASPSKQELKVSTTALTQDEREDFLERENELTDQLAERENELEKQHLLVATLNEQIDLLKQKESTLTTENKEWMSKYNTVQIELERVRLEQNDDKITIETMVKTQEDLEKKVEEMRSEMEKMRTSMASVPISAVSATSTDSLGHGSASVSSPSLAQVDMEKMKQEKAAEMMKPYADVLGQSAQIKQSLNEISPSSTSTSSTVASPSGVSVMTSDAVNKELDELRQKLEITESKMRDYQKKSEQLEAELEGLLDKAIETEQDSIKTTDKLTATMSDFKTKLDEQYTARIKLLEETLEAKVTELASRNSDVHKLKKHVKTLEQKIDKDGIVALRDKLNKQIETFEQSKISLMHDLQNRCEKIVELEITLDEQREKYNSLLKTTDAKAHQKKMAFLQRNLDQLTIVQKQLVDQNLSLKQKLDVAEKKMANRNERILDLEKILQELTAKMTSDHEVHEAEISRLEGKIKELQEHPSSAKMEFSFGGGRVAKPLRGGVPSPVLESSVPGSSEKL